MFERFRARESVPVGQDSGVGAEEAAEQRDAHAVKSKRGATIDLRSRKNDLDQFESGGLNNEGDASDDEHRAVHAFVHEDTPEHRAERQQRIRETVWPKKLVVFGATTNIGPGYFVTKKAAEGAKETEVIGVNPKVDGELIYSREDDPTATISVSCVSDVEQIINDPDFDPDTTTFEFVVNPSALLSILEQYSENRALVRKGIRHAVIITDLGDTDTESGRLNKERFNKVLAENDLEVVIGPNCVGFYSDDPAKGRLDATFMNAVHPPRTGEGAQESDSEQVHEALPIVMVSGSGATMLTGCCTFDRERIPVRAAISMGNATMKIGDLAEAFIGEKAVFGIYAEGIDASDIESIKHIVDAGHMVFIALNRGGEKSSETTGSHTGQALGPEAVVAAAALRQAGAIVLHGNKDQFYDTLKLASITGELGETHGQVGFITNGGGPGAEFADETDVLERVDLVSATPELQAKLRATCCQTTNPGKPIVDVRGDATGIQYGQAYELLAEEDTYGTLVVTVITAGTTPVSEVVEGMRPLKETCDRRGKKLIAVVDGDERGFEAAEQIRQLGIAAFSKADRAANALENVLNASEQMRNMRADKCEIQAERRARTEQLLQGVLADVIPGGENGEEMISRKALLASEVTALFKEYGLEQEMVETISIEPGQHLERALSFENSQKYVAKVDHKVYPGREHLLHKVAGAHATKAVYLGLSTQEEVEKTIAQLQTDFPETNIIVQPEVAANGEKFLVGSTTSEKMQTTVMLGLGGPFAEQLAKATGMVERFNSIPGLNENMIRTALLRGKFGFYFEGCKRSNMEVLDKLVRTISAVFQASLENPEIAAVDCNPVLYDLQDGKLQAVDIKVVLDPNKRRASVEEHKDEEQLAA